MKKDPYLSLIEYCPQWYVAGLSPAAYCKVYYRL